MLIFICRLYDDNNDRYKCLHFSDQSNSSVYRILYNCEKERLNARIYDFSMSLDNVFVGYL